MDQLGIEQARQQLGELVDRARLAKQPTLITRKGKPAAIIVNADWYRQAQELLGGNSADRLTAGTVIGAKTPRPRDATGVLWTATEWRECFAVIDYTNATTGAYNTPVPGEFLVNPDLTGDADCGCDAHAEMREKTR